MEFDQNMVGVIILVELLCCSVDRRTHVLLNTEML